MSSPASGPSSTQNCCDDLPASLPADVVAARASRFKALSDPHRVQLLHLVTAAGEACVCDLTDRIGLSQPTISHHLGVLVKAGLLTRERRGTWAWFRADPAGMALLSKDVAATTSSPVT